MLKNVDILDGGHEWVFVSMDANLYGLIRL